MVPVSLSSTVCYNRYPDEKGTESQQRALARILEHRYNRYPDEKGTESQIRERVGGIMRLLQPLPR